MRVTAIALQLENIRGMHIGSNVIFYLSFYMINAFSPSSLS